MAGYCSPRDLCSYGLPRGAVPNPGRLAARVDTAADAVILGEHGFSAGDELSFRAESGGTLPAPLAAATTYYALPVNDDAFQVAATEGGAAIDLTTTGARVLVIAPLPKEAAIAWGARVIDEMIPAFVPLSEPYPEIVVMTNAELAIWKLASRGGSASKSLADLIKETQLRMQRWSAGAAPRGTSTTARANLAASATAPYRDGRGWNRFGGIS